MSDSELNERVLRSEHRLPTAALSLESTTRKRKSLTAEQLEERRKKVHLCIVIPKCYGHYFI